MAKKYMSWKTKGMNRDLSVTAFNPEFCFENRNLRLGTNEGNTLMSWVNEKGTQELPIVAGNWVAGDDSTLTSSDPMNGVPIGTAVINHQLVVFTHDDYRDYIYILKYANTEKTQLLCKMLFGYYSVSLGFDIQHPIETLVSYESENIQKVYWTDGKNQPRVINVAGEIKQMSSTQFDFVSELQLREDIVVEKILGGNGMFAPGVIQYAFTYYKKYGQETNIFYVSPLLYISYKDRGASPEDKVENSFKITAWQLDLNFDYLRVYSIQRTSINATPICKRVRDISLEDLTSLDSVSFIDTGTLGESVDPAELLYKGGESLVAQTIEQKDNTLFLGNLSISRPMITGTLKNSIISNTVMHGDQTRSIVPQAVSSGYYTYYNQLTSRGNESRHTGRTVPCGGFKTGDIYRCGLQFQYKTGKWSDPVRIDDVQVTSKFSGNSTPITLPIIRGDLKKDAADALRDAGYKRVRPVVVFPSIMDRKVLCQGVVAPTMYTQENRTNNSCYAQSSWFFRPWLSSDAVSDSAVVMPPKSRDYLRYTNKEIEGNNVFNPQYIRQVEIEGEYDATNKFQIDRSWRTFHSPDIEFDEQMSLLDFSGKSFKQRGTASFQYTMSDIDIQTETPTISSSGAGFVHKPFSSLGAAGIVAGLFYDDFIVDDQLDDDKHIGAYPDETQSCKWLIYPWQGSGYLNNDMNRPADKGIGTSKLKKKVISNLRYANTSLNNFSSAAGTTFSVAPQIFNSNEVSILKLNENLYKGNIDTMLTPDNPDGKYFCFNGYIAFDVKTPFNSTAWCKLFNKDPNSQDENGLRKWNSYSNKWEYTNGDIGDDYIDIVIHKSQVRMKYKSTPHLFGNFGNSLSESTGELAIVEISQSPTNIYGGTSEDALRENDWIPCGEPVSLSNIATVNEGTENEYQAVLLHFDYGDTYYQRYDCLKTYPFTREDLNQIVEIGSFMLETRVNIDGRYDRNRGQSNNLNMSPENFNLLNPVYSQVNNFFTYKIQPKDYYENTNYSNQITWSRPKTSGADVDLWTNVTMASTLELDGNKGEVTSLQRFNNNLICFQDSGISRIMYNDNIQVASTTGVPIEIANSDKVQGKDYISDTVGCSNKWTIVAGALGLYFMDSNQKSIYLFNGNLTDISGVAGFNSWCKMYIPSSLAKWNPTFPEISEDRSAFISKYDRMNQEILFISSNRALAYSEKYQVFTSFYDYCEAPFFDCLDDTGIWLHKGTQWKHQAGEYCNFFGTRKPYSTILIGNPEPQISKLFTNMEFRACVDGDGTETDNIFTPYLPFDALETWNEYQHGIAYLANMRGHNSMMHHRLDNTANLNRKFRIWRCDIPRDNADNTDTFDETFDETFHMLARLRKHPQDRMKNPWLYLRLRKEKAAGGTDLGKRAEIHDIVMTYFD